MVHRAGELLVELLFCQSNSVAADHQTPDVDSGFPSPASALVQVVHSPVDLLWSADVVDRKGNVLSH